MSSWWVLFIKEATLLLLIPSRPVQSCKRKKKRKLEEMRTRFVCARIYSHSVEETNAVFEIKYSNILLGRIHEVALGHVKYYINII